MFFIFSKEFFGIDFFKNIFVRFVQTNYRNNLKEDESWHTINQTQMTAAIMWKSFRK